MGKDPLGDVNRFIPNSSVKKVKIATIISNLQRWCWAKKQRVWGKQKQAERSLVYIDPATNTIIINIDLEMDNKEEKRPKMH